MLRLPQLELLARGLADSILAGDTPSVFKGSGMEADGVRAYVPGDDVRAVDWRVTARTGRPHVREFVEERGLEAHLVVDRSASLHHCVSGRPGRAALQTAAVLAAAAHKAGHNVGLLQVTDRAESHVPPAQGRHQLQWILSALAALRPEGTGTALAPALRGLASTLGGRALIMVVSDFSVPAPHRTELATALAQVARRHDLLPVRILIPGVHDLPTVGVVALTDPESGHRVIVDTSDPEVRAGLQAQAREAEMWWDALWKGLALPALTVDPREDLGRQLMVGLARRGGRAA